MQVEGGSVDVVQDFTCLGDNISRDGEITSEVTRRIVRAARAFGCLRVPVFKNKDLSLATKRAVYTWGKEEVEGCSESGFASNWCVR